MYIGQYYDDKKNGVGEFVGNDPCSRYIGTWKNDLREGVGLCCKYSRPDFMDIIGNPLPLNN
jgi:hypothetical protein